MHTVRVKIKLAIDVLCLSYSIMARINNELQRDSGSGSGLTVFGLCSALGVMTYTGGGRWKNRTRGKGKSKLRVGRDG
jgi:hypothetical protein